MDDFKLIKFRGLSMLGLNGLLFYEFKLYFKIYSFKDFLFFKGLYRLGLNEL